MIKDIGILSGFVSSLFIILYSLLYLLRDCYSATNNKFIRKHINRLLPFLTKHNSKFLIIIFILSIIHFLSFSSFTVLINSGYVVLFILLLILKITFFPSKKNISSYNFNIFAYLLLLSLLVHLVI